MALKIGDSEIPLSPIFAVTVYRTGKQRKDKKSDVLSYIAIT